MVEDQGYTGGRRQIQIQFSGKLIGNPGLLSDWGEERNSMLEFSEFYKFHECYILTRHGKVLCVNILINQILEPNVSKLE